VSTYRVDHELGRGGMATVYSGWHEQLARPVALKVLAEHLAGDAAFRTRFLREARIASRLHHPNLVRTYDVSEVDGLPCIVMELVHGSTLEGGRLIHDEAAQVADGLAHAHANGVVHRDLKPANLLRAGGDVKIADFGIARAAEETMVTQVGTVLGTLRYLAPEQAEGRIAGPEADVYSLGVVLDELLEKPTPGDRALIARCLSQDPALRPTAVDVAAGLRGETAAWPTRVIARRHDSRRLWKPLVLAAAAAAAIAAVALAVAFGGGPSEPARVEPVPHASHASQQARNLAAWLKRYSR
jgi:eukaryotic-like serine/threonine-protein kinase